MINVKKLALRMGVFIGGLHLVFSLLVALIPTTFQQFLNWVASMHFIQSTITLLPFNFGRALLLVVITFVIGMIIGKIIGMILNASMDKH